MSEKTETERTSVMIRKSSHRRAELAATLEQRSLIDCVSEAMDAWAKPILKKHKVKVPEEPVSQAA
jgi:hypothetical protein